jgi:hypothetical protein
MGSALAPLPFTGRTPVAISQLTPYNPNDPNSIEAIWQPQYDFQLYPAAGANQLLFFQVPQGQGGKLLNDTNMNLAGQFPAPCAFLCTAIMVPFYPANTILGAAGTQGAAAKTAAAATVATNLNDTQIIANTGWLTITIGSKVYLTDSPLGKFPPNFSIGGLQSAAGTYAAGTQIISDYARAIGRYAEITPLLIPMNQNFVVGLYWPALTVVSTGGRIGVILDGFYYRQSQ